MGKVKELPTGFLNCKKIIVQEWPNKQKLTNLTLFTSGVIWPDVIEDAHCTNWSCTQSRSSAAIVITVICAISGQQSTIEL